MDMYAFLFFILGFIFCLSFGWLLKSEFDKPEDKFTEIVSILRNIEKDVKEIKVMIEKEKLKQLAKKG
jgi:hypothetical protein